ncbi:MAG: hypothetical protein K2K97_03435 [Muribaculaceae bacterium]|nr:hypothetical protein [Muribaculaceae bacterium]
MTEEQKDILIEKMIDRPESLTSEEMAIIASDLELKELYEMSVILTDNMVDLPEPDIDAEWMNIKRRIVSQGHQRHFKRWWIGVAAVFAAVLLCSVAFKYIISENKTVSTPYISEVRSEAPSKPYMAETVDCAEDSIESSQEKKQPMIQQRVSADIASDAEEVDIDEYIRIKQARIDNEVAVALSRLYQEEYSVSMEVLADILDQESVNDSSLIIRYVNGININQITML